ncbi:MAG: 3-hydroxybutyrate dehydrogenase [Pseudomonadota bacterium]
MLAGKSAVITGSTSGIGLGIAKKLAAEGCRVMINGFGDADEIEAIRASLPNDALYDPADMTKPDQIEAMIQRAEAECDGLDIVVNNAGIQFVSPVEDFPTDKWDAIIAINLSSSFHTIKAAVPGMKARKWGRIVNIASAHALVASPFKTAYVAAKHGIAGLTKSAALEVAEDGITVNAICPGYVLTPLVEKQIPATAEARGISEDEVITDVMLAPQPTKQFVPIEDVAAYAAFLCTDDAKSITGALQQIDGGWVAK